MSFEVADQVMLRSGSPPMTVTAVEDHIVTTLWFTEQGKGDEVKRHRWNEAVLVPVASPKRAPRAAKEAAQK